ncbi:ABC transporter permease [Phytohabitans rumicis]|uniref:Peptide ABC transporter permease n=1 Tax=Phytohabitans rumicis TaxID=1076125 RepID=A0A6V8LS68_9ACTN|nr:ABC transporter permease [Phytohabitans rumicis]GFJ95595.1 peptide ABC transporter permease [Phytohabitans rumicis]
MIRRDRARRALDRHRWWFTRLLWLPVHTILFAAAVFFLVFALPGDPVLSMTNGRLTGEQLEQARARFGLTDSIWEQFARFMSDVLHLDLGTSMASGKPVLGEIITVLPATIELAVIGLTVTVLIALAGSFVLLARPHGFTSRVLRRYMDLAGALPDFVVGILLIVVFYTVLHIAPAPIGRFDPLLEEPNRITGFPLLDAVLDGNVAVATSMAGHLVLPVLALALYQSPVLMRLLSHAMHQAAQAPPTIFRISCGVRRRDVWLSILRRSLPAMVSMLGTMLGTLLGGAIVLEQLFGFGGLGKYLVSAVTLADATAIRGFLIVVGALTLVLFVLVDLTNMLLDPRRRPGSTGAER